MSTTLATTSRSLRDESNAGNDTSPIIRNKLLNLLSPADLASVLEASTSVTVKSKDILFRPDGQISSVYFPEDCIISLVVQMADGSGVEAMTVGNDGFAPLAAFNGVETTGLLACGQVTGTARRMTRVDFVRIRDNSVEFTSLLRRYAQLVFEAVAQSAACNRLHVVEQRCARWLLMSHDRVGRSTFDLTQGFLAQMLGVRRAGVTVAIGILERQGFLSHARGAITIVDREGLQSASCECYRAVKRREAKILTATSSS